MKGFLYRFIFIGLFFVSCSFPPIGLTLYVSDSYGGCAVEGATVIIGPPTGQFTGNEERLKTKSDGTVLIEDSEETFSILVSKDGYAQSMLQNYSMTGRRNRKELVLPILGIEGARVGAPIIRSVKIESAGGTEMPLVAGTQFAQTGRVIVEVAGVNPVLETPNAGFGIAMMGDRVPTGLGLLRPSRVGELLQEVISDSSSNLYVTEAQFSYENLFHSKGKHSLYFVGYDTANNRVEMSIPVLCGGQFGEVESIESLTPNLKSFEMKTFGINRQIFSSDNFNSLVSDEYRSGTGYMVFTIAGLDEKNQVIPYDGFELWRVEDGKFPFERVYVSQLTAASFSYQLVDVSLMLQPNKKYDYKIRAFNRRGYSNFIRVSNVLMLPEHKVFMVAPEDGAEINPSETPLIFKIEGLKALFDVGIDSYIFSPRIRSVDGSQELTVLEDRICTIIWLNSENSFYIPLEKVPVKIEGLSLNQDSEELSINLVEMISDLNAKGFDSNFEFRRGVPYEWYLSYGTHGPTARLTRFKWKDGKPEEVGKSVSIASSVEFKGAIDGSARVFICQ